MDAIDREAWPCLDVIPDVMVEDTSLVAISTYDGRPHIFLHTTDLKSYWIVLGEDLKLGMYTLDNNL